MANNNIENAHNKILNYFLDIRKTNKNFYFNLRKKNNSGRLEKGYWFIGDGSYLVITFWTGGDSQRKYYCINFLMEKEGTYLVLSSREQGANYGRIELLKELSKKFKCKIWERDNGRIMKNYWYYKFPNSDYMVNLKSFIKKIPIINEIVSKYPNSGIKPIEEHAFNMMVNRVNEYRTKKIKISEKKISRICWNENNWIYPSGQEGKSTNKTYERDNGYGNEEWLFDRSKMFRNYHYSFLEPIRKSKQNENKTFDIYLYTIKKAFSSKIKSKKYFIGIIRNVETVLPVESQKIYKHYKKMHWISEMRDQLTLVHAKKHGNIFTNPKEFFNIKFKFEDIQLNEDLLEISDMEKSITTDRYKLLDFKNEFLIAEYLDEDDSEASEDKRKTKKIKRKGRYMDGIEIDPTHKIMQNVLKEILVKSKKYIKNSVQIEKGRVDVKGKTKNAEMHYFEIKTAPVVKSIRYAFGQIMEYGFYPNVKNADKLTIVTLYPKTDEVISYFKFLRENFNLPIYYLSIDIFQKTVIDEC